MENESDIINRTEITGGVMQEIIQNFAEKNHIDTIKAVDITSLSVEENRGFSYAILLVKVLPKELSLIHI